MVVPRMHALVIKRVMCSKSTAWFVDMEIDKTFFTPTKRGLGAEKVLAMLRGGGGGFTHKIDVVFKW